MKRKNEIAKTRDEKDAEQLLAKITNKAVRNLPEFWKNNEKQFMYNNVAIKEALKMSVNKNNKEVFKFFWNKAKEQGKDLSKDSLFIKNLVEIYMGIDDIKFIDCFIESIGFSKLIKQGNAFKVILDSKNKDILKDKKLDIFKYLYKKAYDENLPEIALAIEATLINNFDDAILFCLENEQNKPNTKLVKVWENAVNTFIKKGNEDMAIKILECIGNKMPNFSYANVYLCAIENNCQNVANICFIDNKSGVYKKIMDLSKKKFVLRKKLEV